MISSIPPAEGYFQFVIPAGTNQPARLPRRSLREKEKKGTFWFFV